MTRTPQHVVGVDLGGTHLQAGIVDEAGRIVHRLGVKTHAERGAEAVIEAVASACDTCCKESGIPIESLGGLGFAAPGAIDFDAGVVINAPNLGWTDLPVVRMLRDRLGGLPVALENDVNAAALAEARIGAGRGAKDALAIWVGTGVGGGIILNGRVHRGPLGTAGEIGQTLSTPDLHDVTGARMERHASRGFVTQSIRVALDGGRASTLQGIKGRISASDLAKAYEAGDPLVTEHVDRATDWLGVAVANAITFMGVPLILLGGGLAEEMPPAYPERLLATIRKAMFPAAYAEKVDVRVTELRENAGLLGAALTVRDHLER